MRGPRLAAVQGRGGRGPSRTRLPWQPRGQQTGRLPGQQRPGVCPLRRTGMCLRCGSCWSTTMCSDKVGNAGRGGEGAGWCPA
jgi:hypothetical protein